MGQPTEHRFVVEVGAPEARIDAWLSGRGLPFSRAQLQRRITAGEVSVNGEVVQSPSRRVRAGDQVVLRVPPPAPTVDAAEDIPLVILFEDPHLIVLDKPAGLVVHPATSHERGTLVNALLAHCGPAALAIGGERRPGIVHRLDKDTSGVMVVAKDEPTLVGLQAQFSSHSLDRRYLALVAGVVPESGTYRTLYGRHSYDRKRFSSKVRTGKTAVTHFQAIERLPGATLIEVRLETGRTHQIRVHFADHGHPVVGDATYGGKPKDPRLRGVAARLGRQALHAAVLAFRHPITEAPLSFRTEPPPDMRAALDSLRTATAPG